MYDFQTQVRKGHEGEELVALYLLEAGLVRTVFNRTMFPEFQKKGIDFLCEDPGGYSLGLEVKTDSYTSGNFFFETVSRCEGEVPGCFVSSRADVWFYLFSRWDRGYWLPLEATRRFVLSLEHEWRKVGTSTGRNGVSYTSSGYLVPIAAVVEGVPGVAVHEGIRRLAERRMGGVPCLN